MYIKNIYIKRFYRLLFLLLCELGLVLQYAVVAPTGNARMLTCYYAVLTNLLALLYFFLLGVVRPKKEGALLKGAVVIAIAITGLVYHFMLNGAIEANAGQITALHTLAGKLLHYVTPLMVFGDYLLFSPKGQFKGNFALIWLVLPTLYTVFILFRAHFGTGVFTGFHGRSRYPYPFMDVELYGIPKVALMLGVMLILSFLLGYILFLLDHLLGKVHKDDD